MSTPKSDGPDGRPDDVDEPREDLAAPKSDEDVAEAAVETDAESEARVEDDADGARRADDADEPREGDDLNYVGPAGERAEIEDADAPLEYAESAPVERAALDDATIAAAGLGAAAAGAASASAAASSEPLRADAAARAPKARRSGLGFFGASLLALVSGAVGAGGALIGGPELGLLPKPGAVAAIEARLDALAGEAAAAKTSADESAAALAAAEAESKAATDAAAKIAADFDAYRAELSDTLVEQAGKTATALEAARDQAVGEIGALAGAGESARADLGEKLAALTGKLDDALAEANRERESAAAREETRDATLTAIREQVASLAAAVAATPLPPGAEAGAGGDIGLAASLTRLGLLEGGLRRIEARVNGLTAEALPTPDLSRIDVLEAFAAEAKTLLAELDGRLQDVERSERSLTSGRAAAGVAFSALALAAEGASPFVTELATLETTADVVASDRLKAYAKTGVPSDVLLASTYDAAARAALKAAARARVADGEGSFLDRFASVVTIRRKADERDVTTFEADSGNTESVDELVRRAGELVAAGDMLTAVSELELLPEPARVAMGQWLVDASNRAALEQELVILRAAALGLEPED